MRFFRRQQTIRARHLAYAADLSALLVASAGSGKFSCAIAPTLLTNTADHVIVFDPKGQAAAVTGGSIKRDARAWRRDGL